MTQIYIMNIDFHNSLVKFSNNTINNYNFSTDTGDIYVFINTCFKINFIYNNNKYTFSDLVININDFYDFIVYLLSNETLEFLDIHIILKFLKNMCYKNNKLITNSIKNINIILDNLNNNNQNYFDCLTINNTTINYQYNYSKAYEFILNNNSKYQKLYIEDSLNNFYNYLKTIIDKVDQNNYDIQNDKNNLALMNTYISNYKIRYNNIKLYYDNIYEILNIIKSNDIRYDISNIKTIVDNINSILTDTTNGTNAKIDNINTNLQKYNQTTTTKINKTNDKHYYSSIPSYYDNIYDFNF